ncbi:MAG: UbiA family prenyltransferase [Anaerolineales bacterium]
MTESIPMFKDIKQKIDAFARLTRWADHGTFGQLAFGFLIGTGFAPTGEQLVLLLKALFVLVPLLYAGIYALNDYRDAELDKKNKFKRSRPIPSGQIKRDTALMIALGLIASGLIIATFINAKVLIMAVSFLIINLLYTFVFKNTRHIEIFLNAVPHVFRLLFGIWLVADPTPYGMLGAIWLVGNLNICVFRRIKEIEEKNFTARPVLKRYNKRTLASFYYLLMPALVILTFSAGALEIVAGVFWLGFSTLVIAGYYRSKPLKRIIEEAWK